MLRKWIFGGISVLAAVAFFADQPAGAGTWFHGCCDNGKYYLGGNGFRGHGLFICGQCFSGGWQGGPDGGTVGYGYINVNYHGTLGDIRAGRTGPLSPPPTLPYGTLTAPTPYVPPTPTPAPTPLPTPAPAYD